ncbi:MAG TPA: penicillin acylase family protein, partial [Gemmatimonadaceae bacterium]|nr:penicillin acylase family protein [Gemmatimonadaceae bacterium]
MRTRLIRAAASVVVLGGLLYAGARHAGPLPPLGPLLDPVHGAWSAATHATLPREATATIPGLSGPVEIRYDQRGVPHIFARTRDDVIRGLGYVVARDRMFQLELQARAASGTLTELVGKVALPLDQRTRALGMPRAAEQAYAALDTAGSESHLLRAYADGINAYIDATQPADW